MKRRKEIIVIGVVAAAAAVFAMKRGGRPECGSGAGGACCPLISGPNLWPTNPCVAVAATNGKPEVTASETITNRQQ
jgi:hypothetical protein